MRSDETSLLHIRDNIHAARLFTNGLSYEAFAASRLTFYATTRALERMIWITVQDHLGPLLAAVEAELGNDMVNE